MRLQLRLARGVDPDLMRGMIYRVGVAFDGVAGLSKALRKPESFGKASLVVHRSLGGSPSE